MATIRTTTAALLATLAWSSRGQAAEVPLEAGVLAGASTWRGDAAGGFMLRGGVRFSQVIGVDALVWEQLARVDQRINTGLTLGVTGLLPFKTIRPFARIFAIHQHEEAWVSVREHPFTTVLGIGAGIRHRAGGGLGLGAELPLLRSGTTLYYASSSLMTTWFPDATLGPSVYFALSLSVGVSFDVAVSP